MALALKYLGHRCPEDSAIKPWYFEGRLSLQVGQCIALAPERWTMIGRSKNADLRLASNGVARRHIRVRPTDRGTLAIEDLGGTNGTQVLGECIERSELRVGETFSVALYFDFEVVESEREATAQS